MIRYCIFFITGAALWRLGGWHYKWARRYVFPFFIAISSFVKNIKTKKKWLQILLFPLLIGAFCLGYGDNRTYLQRFIVGCAWVAPRFYFLGFGWFAATVPVIWIILFWLSNNSKTKKYFKWFWVEMITGGCVGLAYA